MLSMLLSHDRWFSPGTLDSSTTKIGRHDIADLLLSGVKHQKSDKKIKSFTATTFPSEGLPGHDEVYSIQQ